MGPAPGTPAAARTLSPGWSPAPTIAPEGCPAACGYCPPPPPATCPVLLRRNVTTALAHSQGLKGAPSRPPPSSSATSELGGAEADSLFSVLFCTSGIQLGEKKPKPRQTMLQKKILQGRDIFPDPEQINAIKGSHAVFLPSCIGCSQGVLSHTQGRPGGGGLPPFPPHQPCREGKTVLSRRVASRAGQLHSSRCPPRGQVTGFQLHSSWCQPPGRVTGVTGL